MNNEVLTIARKWYKKIPFPKEFDAEFEALLSQQTDLMPISFASYDLAQNQTAYGKNLVMFLYFCEELSQRYTAAGIPEDILLATLEDFVIMVQRNRILHGHIGLVKASVLKDHFSMRLFRLGRLVFCMEGAYVDIPEIGVCKGDPMMDVHIPTGEPLTLEACNDSFARAQNFFAKYFPEYKYSYYMCFSWLLDDTLHQFLKPGSNILQFQKLFKVVHRRETDSILHFMFKYGIEDREELRDLPANTDFAKQIKEYALSGGAFYQVLGIRSTH